MKRDRIGGDCLHTTIGCCCCLRTTVKLRVLKLTHRAECQKANHYGKCHRPRQTGQLSKPHNHPKNSIGDFSGFRKAEHIVNDSYFVFGIS
jgi:hypothetical protein